MSKENLKKFTCKVCKTVYFDLYRYFHDIKSEKCIWCAKFPKKKSR